MLQIRNLNITHKKDLRIIIDNFQLVLNPGDKAVIIGEEGNGKSTLLKWIYEPALIENYAEAEGDCICPKERLGYLPQELDKNDAGKSVYEYFCEEPFFWEQTPKQLSQLGQKLQLSQDFFYREQKMGTLSGGERIKAQIARILMAEPTVLLLDEPSNDIDIPTLEWLERLIFEWDQVVLFISHDETLIENTANMVIHMEQIRRKTMSRYTVAPMPYAEYIEKRMLNMQRQEQLALNERREEKIREEKLRRIQQKVEHDQANLPKKGSDSAGRLLKKKMKVVKSMERRYEREAAHMTQLLETEEAIFFKFGENIKIPSRKIILDFSLEQLTVPSFTEYIGSEGMQRILSRNIQLQIKGPQKICIIGKNGVGKSTLIRKIADSFSERKDIRMAYMPQNYEDLLDMTLSPIQYLDTSGEKAEITRIRTYLGSMKYTAEEMNRPILELSGGQKAKVLLLKMCLSGAEVLILDEPTRNFSPLSNPVIRNMLAEYQGVIISISHDRKYINEVCHVVYELTEEGLVGKKP